MGDCRESLSENLKNFIAAGEVRFLPATLSDATAGCSIRRLIEETSGKEFFHRYSDHRQIKAGPEGKVLTRDRFGMSATVIGRSGGGTVVHIGETFGMNRKDMPIDPDFPEWLRFFTFIRSCATLRPSRGR